MNSRPPSARTRARSATRRATAPWSMRAAISPTSVRYRAMKSTGAPEPGEDGVRRPGEVGHAGVGPRAVAVRALDQDGVAARGASGVDVAPPVPDDERGPELDAPFLGRGVQHP